MIDHTDITVSRLAVSKAFYEAALAPLGYVVSRELEDAAGFIDGGSAAPVPPRLLRRFYARPGRLQHRGSVSFRRLSVVFRPALGRVAPIVQAYFDLWTKKSIECRSCTRLLISLKVGIADKKLISLNVVELWQTFRFMRSRRVVAKILPRALQFDAQ